MNKIVFLISCLACSLLISEKYWVLYIDFVSYYFAERVISSKSFLVESLSSFKYKFFLRL
jgi:hypothetical protein